MTTIERQHIPVAKPLIGEAEKRAVMEVLDSGHLAQGPRTEAFEQSFAAYIGTKHAIGVNSGTAALIVALQAHGVGPGDEPQRLLTRDALLVLPGPHVVLGAQLGQP